MLRCTGMFAGVVVHLADILRVLMHRYYARDEPPGTSVFVRDLPAEVTTDKLVAAFQEFGTLRGPHPVSLKIIKGKENIAFVDFEDSSAQRAAIAGPVLIDGHKVCELALPLHAFLGAYDPLSACNIL